MTMPGWIFKITFIIINMPIIVLHLNGEWEVACFIITHLSSIEMRRLIILLFVLIGYTVEAQIISQPDAYTLDQRDLFIITEYKETEYQVFVDHDSLNLPANLSTVNYYVDINDQTDSSNMIDINYLYLQGYHEAKKTSGQLFYL